MVPHEFNINQPAGSGQGYFFFPSPPGGVALVELFNQGSYVLRLVIARYNQPPITHDVAPLQHITVGSNAIQSVGVIVLPNPLVPPGVTGVGVLKVIVA